MSQGPSPPSLPASTTPAQSWAPTQIRTGRSTVTCGPREAFMKNKVLQTARILFGKGPTACLMLFLLFAARSPAAERQLLPGHVPAAVRALNLQPNGQLPPTNQLQLAIGLPLRNQQELTSLLAQIYDPA